MTIKTKELYCISVNTVTIDDGKQTDEVTTYITFNKFKQSLIDERWENETRYNPKYTLFGQQFTKTKDHHNDNSYRERNFIFPDSLETAERLHELHKPKSI